LCNVLVRFASVVFGVHEDTHDEQTIRMLEFVSTGIVRLQALPEGAKWNIPVTGSMQVTEKRKNGKVTRSVRQKTENIVLIASLAEFLCRRPNISPE
jgi:hypothetical protein